MKRGDAGFEIRVGDFFEIIALSQIIKAEDSGVNKERT